MGAQRTRSDALHRLAPGAARSRDGVLASPGVAAFEEVLSSDLLGAVPISGDKSRHQVLVSLDR